MSLMAQLVCLPVATQTVEEPPPRRMSSPRLSPAAQVHYLLQWFEEWSELQRQDFLPLLAEKLAQPATYINGVVNSMAAVNCENKPMSLFQCRIKLFNEWYPTWNEEERARLVKGISDTDPDFGRKLQAELDPTPANLNGDSEHQENTEVTEQLEREAVTPPLDSSEIEPEETIPESPEREEVVQESVQENTMPLEIAATS